MRFRRENVAGSLPLHHVYTSSAVQFLESVVMTSSKWTLHSCLWLVHLRTSPRGETSFSRQKTFGRTDTKPPIAASKSFSDVCQVATAQRGLL